MLIFNQAEFRTLRRALWRVLPLKNRSAANILCSFQPKGGSAEVTSLQESLRFEQGLLKGPAARFLLRPDVFQQIESCLKGNSQVLLTLREGRLQAVFTGKSGQKSILTFPAGAGLPEVSESIPELREIDLHEFTEAFRLCSLSASKDETRPAIRSVFYNAKDKALISTDGRRLTEIKCSLPCKSDMLLPVTATLKSRLFKGKGAIGSDGGRFFISNSGFSYSVTLMKERFPDYQKVI